jgi:CDP-diacylglycerol--glycerol-3-phosphate 3-phosphatidyltransferase
VNLPNALTVLRVLLVPVLLAFFVWDMPAGHWIAAVLFAVASFTDLLDGYFARRQGIQSSFGVFLDLTADKLLVLSTLIALVQLGQVQAWSVIVIMAREVIISGLRSYAAAAGLVIAAGPWGKLKTVVTMVAMIGVIGGIEPYGTWLYYVAVALTLYSGVDYIWSAAPVLAQRGGEPAVPV